MLTDNQVKAFTNSARSTFYQCLSEIYNKEYWGGDTSVYISLRDDFWGEEVTELIEQEICRLLKEYGIFDKYATVYSKKYGSLEIKIPKVIINDDQ